MNREFKMIVALSVSVVLCFGLLAACAENAPKEDETFCSTAGPIQTTAGNSSTVEQTVAGSVPGTESDPGVTDAEVTIKITQSNPSGGNNDNSAIGNDSDPANEKDPGTAPTQGNNPDSNNDSTNTDGKPSANDGTEENTQSSTKPTAVPVTDGNSTEIVVPITPTTTEPPSQDGTETSVQKPTANGSASGGDGQTEDPTTAPGEPDDGESGNVSSITYEEYMNMSGEDQMAYFESFASVEDYFAWYNEAKAAYDKQNPPIEIEDGSIDLGELMGGNG